MIINLLARRDLRRKIREGESLLRRVLEDDSHDIEIQLYHWRDNCRLVIKNYFGEDHFLFQDIYHTGFSIGVEVLDPGVSEVRRDYTAIYREGIEICLQVLRACQKEIKDKK